MVLDGRSWLRSEACVCVKTVRITLSTKSSSLLAMPDAPALSQTPSPESGQFLIQGRTHAGKTFRPSDWAERLAGVLSPYRPGYSRETGTNPYAQPSGFSPYAQPVVVAGLKCVAIDARLAELEPMAWDFVVSFARDNDLPMAPACLVDLGLSKRPVPSSPAG